MIESAALMRNNASEEVPTMSDVDTNGEKRRRNKRWPEALKREIVAATLVPGASVSVVARQHNVNANQVFSWRRRYGEASELLGRPPSTSGLVPVTITPEPENVGATSPAPTTSETIEIEVGGDCRVVSGAASPRACLAQAAF